MADELSQIRLDKRQKRISNAIASSGRKLDDIMSAENALDGALEDADRKKISEYSLNEQIAYSNITVTLYQDEIKLVSKISHDANTVKEYKPGFGSKAIDALGTGWTILSSIFLFLISIWPILLIAIIFAVIYFKIRNKKNEE